MRPFHPLLPPARVMSVSLAGHRPSTRAAALALAALMLSGCQRCGGSAPDADNVLKAGPEAVTGHYEVVSHKVNEGSCAESGPELLGQALAPGDGPLPANMPEVPADPSQPATPSPAGAVGEGDPVNGVLPTQPAQPPRVLVLVEKAPDGPPEGTALHYRMCSSLEACEESTDRGSWHMLWNPDLQVASVQVAGASSATRQPGANLCRIMMEVGTLTPRDGQLQLEYRQFVGEVAIEGEEDCMPELVMEHGAALQCARREELVMKRL